MVKLLSGICVFMVLSVQALSADSGETVQAILGRTLENENVKNAHIYADGTFDGTFNGIAYAGVWSLEQGQFCRELTRGLTSKHSCLDLKAVRDSDGQIVAVDFLSAGSISRFNVQ